MKTMSLSPRPAAAGRLIAKFGSARLVRTRDGRTHLQGGTRADHIEAREWISLFMHDAVPPVKPVRRV